MPAEDVKGYLDNKNFEYKESGDDYILAVCPICGDSRGGKFGIHKLMGVWHCFACGERGNLWTLKESLGDLQAASAVSEAFGEEEVTYHVVSIEEVEEHHQQLLQDPSAKQWLYERQLGDDAIKAFVLGVVYNDRGRFITIPYFKEGLCVNIKYRSLPPLEKMFQVKPKHETPLYNVDVLEDCGDEVILVEGELDCISMAMMGYPNVVSLPQGAENFDSDHWDALVGFRRIFIVLDPDAAGRSGIKKLAIRLGADRCHDVRIPNGMDPNELLVKYNYEGAKSRLDACIADSKPFGVGEVLGVHAALQELEDHITKTGNVESGFATPWPSVNRILGMVSPGEVVLLQAIPKTGKTTLAQQWLSWLAEQHKVPSMMYCLEMPLYRLAQSLVAGTTLTPRDQLSTLQVKMTMLKYQGVPFYYGTIPEVWDFAHIEEVITYSVRRFGVRIVCFDNLQLLCRSSQNVFQEQAAVSRGFKQLAMSLDIAIILVVQPKKVSEKASPGMYDTLGSSSIIADADGMLTIWRKPKHVSGEVVTDGDLRTIEEDSFDPETLVRVPVSRYRAGGQAFMWFDGKVATLTEVDSSHLETSERVSGIDN